MSEPVIVPGKKLIDKLAWLKSNAQSDNSYIIEVKADETIEPQQLSYEGKSNITITLKGMESKRTIKLSSEGALFTISKGVTLVLENNITLHGIRNNHSALVVVYGEMIMNSGSAIIKNSGGGVLVFGTFNMNDGTISDNTAFDSSGGVTVSGTFNMNGGTISGNSTDVSAGGVLVTGISMVNMNGGTFNMNGGTISGNTTKLSGGGVFVGVGTFNMNGGTIFGNIAHEGGCGGVCVGRFISAAGEIAYGVFKKKGGTITGYASDTANGNYAANGTGWGHAVGGADYDGFIKKFKDTTAGPMDNMSYKAGNGRATGAWDREEKGCGGCLSFGCYVATCVYGSYDCPEVWTLRRYRDDTLSSSWFGRWFIRIYYAISPKVVELFGNKKWFNSLWKPILDIFIRKLQQSGIDSSPYSDV